MFVTIIQLIMITMGGVGSFQFMQGFGKSIFESTATFGGMTALMVLVGCGVGFVLGGVTGRFLLSVSNMTVANVQKMPTMELVLTAIGLAVGIIIATPLAWFFKDIDIFGPYLSVLSFVILGYLGMQLAVRRQGDLSDTLNGFDANASLLETKDSLFQGRVSAGDKLVDTSVIIDGRIMDIARTKFLEGRLLIPRFVLAELQALADSSDPLKRDRGRKGLVMLDQIKQEKDIRMHVVDLDYPRSDEVDDKLVGLALEIKASILTTDYNLNKVAKLQGAQVLNVNDLANALKPVVLPGERLEVKVIKEGKESGQGIAYLDDGTMIVVEDGKRYIGRRVEGVVTSVLQTPAGRMIFVRVQGAKVSTA